MKTTRHMHHNTSPTPEPRIFNLFKSPGIDSACLCSMAGRYHNPNHSRFLAPTDCLKTPAQILLWVLAHVSDPYLLGNKSQGSAVLQSLGCYSETGFHIGMNRNFVCLWRRHNCNGPLPFYADLLIYDINYWVFKQF